jgi:DNA-nicking Smr family endonuclease
MSGDEEIFDYPVDGILDLHMFLPKDVKSVLSEYLTECRARGILRVRIIHGKGSGVLREIVRSFLKKCPYCLEFQTPSDSSGWGATVAILKPLEKNEE